MLRVNPLWVENHKVIKRKHSREARESFIK